MVSGSFHSPPGVLFTFPSRYWCAIGHWLVFSLPQWSAGLPAGFHVPRRTSGSRPAALGRRVRGCHPLWPAFPGRSAVLRRCRCGGPRTPSEDGLGSSAFARRYSRNRLNLSFPPGTEMFQFPGCRPVGHRPIGPRRFGRGGCPIRRSVDRSSLPAPHRLSQVVASFIAFQCQGIRCTP